MKDITGLPAAEFVRRRKALMRDAGNDAILILPAAPERVRSHDTLYPYRQDSDFWYLCGFPEPEAVLVLVPGRKHGEAILFCREHDALRELYDGARFGQHGAVEVFGMDDAYPIDDLDEILPGLLEGRSRVHHHFGRNKDFDLKLIGWVQRVRSQVAASPQSRGAQAHEFLELGHLLHEMRLFKSNAEIELMQHAADVSVLAHETAMRAAKPGMFEHELQAELERVLRAHGMPPAYNSIVGSGANACVLHYGANNRQARDGELVLIDAAGEWRGYASDITRTFPVNGRFSKEQRVLHDLVGAAQKAALAWAKPGVAYETGHNAAVGTLVEGLLSLGLLQGDAGHIIESGEYRRFYPHKSGHWLGLDVHDVGDYRIDGQSRMLEAGMAFTVEPGIYVRPDDDTVDPKWRGIGIRTEDNVLITGNGHVVLTEKLVRDADAIEALMAH